MATPSTPPFSNFRDAFCHRYRCAPEQFERRMFFKALYPFRSLLALPIWWFNRRLFAIDLDVVNAVGKCSDKEECQSLLEEFYNANQVERGFRRGTLRIRVSGTRAIEVWDEVSPLIQPAASVDPLAGATISAGASALSPKGANMVALRKLRQLHEAITHGEPVAKVLEGAGMTRDQFVEQLTLNSPGNPAVAWLREYVEKEQRLEQAERQVGALNQLVASQSLELSELRRRAGGA